MERYAGSAGLRAETETAGREEEAVGRPPGSAGSKPLQTQPVAIAARSLRPPPGSMSVSDSPCPRREPASEPSAVPTSSQVLSQSRRIYLHRRRRHPGVGLVESTLDRNPKCPSTR